MARKRIADIGHLQIHEGDVRLEVDRRRDALAQKRMVISGEDSDRLRFGVHERAFFLRRNEKGPPLEAP